MVKRKRSLRGDTDQGEPSAITPDTVPPTAPPTSPKNPFAKWLIGLTVLTAVIIGGPVAIWAKTDTDGKRVNVEVAQLEKMQEQLKALQQTLQSLTGEQTEGAVTCKTDEGRAECLNDCRRALAKCRVAGQGQETTDGLDSCLSRTNTCINLCNEMPRPPIACQDRCAVALGGCLESAVGAKEATESLIVCLQNNKTCLVKACKLKNPTAIPNDACQDQCKRMDAVCRGGETSYNKDSIAVCDKLKGLCERNMCQIKLDEKAATKVEPTKPAGTCTDEKIKACSGDYDACLKESDADVCQKDKDSCLAECVSPAMPVVCDDRQAYVCDKINLRCGELNETEGACDTLGVGCRKSCGICTADNLVACYDKYNKCTTAKCFNEVSVCFTNCGKPVPVPTAKPKHTAPVSTTTTKIVPAQ